MKEPMWEYLKNCSHFHRCKGSEEVLLEWSVVFFSSPPCSQLPQHQNGQMGNRRPGRSNVACGAFVRSPN